MTTPRTPLTLDRITRLFATCRKPTTAYRAHDRVYALSQRATGQTRHELLGLSYALNAHRLMLAASEQGDISGTRIHARLRNLEVQHALGAFGRAA